MTDHRYNQRTAQTALSGWPFWFGNFRVMNIVIFAAVVSLFVGYLALNNQSAAYGFRLGAIERRIADLEEQRKRLDFEILGRQTMGNIESQVLELGFVPVSKVEYLNGAAGAVALNSQ
ncbi:MAG: hypothetical protein WCT10_00505 [Patescibacteria group bacterium]|jgi:hypothetical protein